MTFHLPLKLVDDASSSSVQIHFHTASPDPLKPLNLQSKCDKIVFKNNGMAFRPEDWLRLKRIAEGNPGNSSWLHKEQIHQLTTLPY